MKEHTVLTSSISSSAVSSGKINSSYVSRKSYLQKHQIKTVMSTWVKRKRTGTQKMNLRLSAEKKGQSSRTSRANIDSMLNHLQRKVIMDQSEHITKSLLKQ